MNRFYNKCGEQYSLTHDNFGQYKYNGMVSYRSTCRKCMAKNSKRWRQNNPDKREEEDQTRRSRENRAGGKPDDYWKHVILSNQDRKCYYCGKSIRGGQLDHKTPLAQGGTSAPENLAVVCKQCNTEKHAKTENEYREWRKDRNMPTNF
jgi:5-methylcytosine-specific restriction endonuclease McrA